MRLLTIGLLHFLVSLSAPAQSQSLASNTEVDLALVLAVDVSESVNEIDYSIQREGIKSALLSEEVIRLLQQCNLRGFALNYVEWSGPNGDRSSSLSEIVAASLVGWHEIVTVTDLRDFAEEIDSVKRGSSGNTDIAGALTFASAELGNIPFQASRKVILLSSDGLQNNSVNGMDGSLFLSQIRDSLTDRNINIHALYIHNNSAIGTDAGLAYFRDHVSTPEIGFTTAIEGFDGYRDALIQLFQRELNNCGF